MEKQLNEKAKNLFGEAMSTLAVSWGGDTPPEAVWAFNEFLDFYEEITGVKIPKVEEDNLDYDVQFKMLGIE